MKLNATESKPLRFQEPKIPRNYLIYLQDCVTRSLIMYVKHQCLLQWGPAIQLELAVQQ